MTLRGRGAVLATLVVLGLVTACGGGSTSRTSTATSATGSEPPSSQAISGSVGTDREVTFTVDGLVVHGSLRMPPDASGAVPGAVLLAGSGPTDRNGNSALSDQRFDTLSGVADVLAADGVASLRYDKLGTGSTGLGPFAGKVEDLTYQDFTDEASAALGELAASPGIDSSKLLLVGHSEGALIALSVAARPAAEQPPVVGVALLEPAGQRYLDLLDSQIREVILPGLVQAGKLTQAQSDTAASSLPVVTASIRRTGTVPDGTSPILEGVGLSPTSARFLQTADAADAPDLARQVVATGRVALLTTCSTQDTQVPCGQAALIDRAAAGPHLTAITLGDATHTLDLASAAGPSTGGAPPFSHDLPPRLTQWLQATTR